MDDVIVLEDEQDDSPNARKNTDWISRLPYEEEVMLDAFLDDVVFITARGLGMERLFLNHLHLYSDPAFSVLVLNTESEDQHFYIEKLKSLNPLAPPRLLTADVLVKDRELIYKGGGVQFVTSRILMVDLLTDKVPLDRIAGILVYKAHHALSTFQDTFILRLFREKKPDGFVKCFTDVPTAVTSGGLGQLQRLVNRLYVKKVRILPRFEESVKRDFDNASPSFIEMSIDLPANQRRIRASLVDIIGTCIRELKQCTQGLDIEVEAETISSSAALRPTSLEMELRSKTLLLTDRQERLLNDLRILRRTLKTFEDLDPASVHKILYFYKSNQEYVENNSGWLNTPTAAKIFLGIDALCCAKYQKGDTLMIPPPKWTALADALKEIKEKLKSAEYKGKTSPVLVFCSSEATCRQLIDVCKFGVQKMAWLQTQVYYNELRRPYKTPEPDEESLWSTTNLAYYDDQVLEKDKKDLMEEVKKVQKAQTRKTRRKLSTKLDIPDPKQPKLVNFGLIRHAEKLKEKRPKKVELPVDTPSSSQASNPLEKAFCEEESLPSTQDEGFLPPLLFLTLGSHYQLIDSLETLRPSFIILYHTELGSFRLIESYKAHHPSVPLTIYALTYPNSTEEERYLSAMQNEQLSMESLIKELGTLLINTDFDTSRETASNLREIALKNDSRLAKNKDDVDEQLQPMVVIDVREFQSELPIVLYQNGIDLYPCTLEVGDYILSPTICVERKALDDLAQSLNNGRVFKQIEQMQQHYDRIILLIESSEKFRKKRVNGGPFQGELSKRSADTRSLLCQLIRSQPKLTCLWSLSPSHSAELFEEIKLDQQNPDSEKAMAIKTDDFSILDEPDVDETSSSEMSVKQAKFNQTTRRALQSLPDINMGDLDKCLRSNKFQNVKELCCGSAEDYMKSGFTEKQADEFIQLFNTDFRLVDG